MGQALRVTAKENREMRMQEAERKAASLPAKLTVPMIIFFLPCLFVVIMGPAYRVTRLLSDSVSNGEQVQWTCESSEGRELERAAGAETSSGCYLSPALQDLALASNLDALLFQRGDHVSDGHRLSGTPNALSAATTFPGHSRSKGRQGP